MEIEELLKPRFRVIADYPGSQFAVGEILEFNKIQEQSVMWFYEKYPHLFKELEWWEERPIEDFPEYVSYPNKNNVYKITWISESGSFKGMLAGAGTLLDAHLTYTQPATKEEYEAKVAKI